MYCIHHPSSTSSDVAAAALFFWGAGSKGEWWPDSNRDAALLAVAVDRHQGSDGGVRNKAMVE